MNRFSPPRRSARLALVALAAVASLAGCAHKITQTDSSYASVEGRPSPDARMLTWIQGPTVGYLFNDGLTFGDITDDVFKGPLDLSDGVAGAVHLQILDRTSASGYELFRRDANGGYRSVLDYPIRPSIKWLESGWELYSYLDAAPLQGAGSNYVARGLLQGVSGLESPLTNTAPPEGGVAHQTLLITIGNRLQSDSTMNVTWTTDPTAAGYWLEVMPFGLADGKPMTDLQKNEPLPILEPAGGKATLIAYLPASASSSADITFLTGAGTFNNGGGTDLGVRAVLHRNVMYYARVCAVDASGRVINRLRGDYRLDYTGAVDRLPDPGGVLVAAPVYKLRPIGGVVFGSFAQSTSEKPPIDFIHDFRTYDRIGVPGPAGPARGGALARGR